jgi:hypothetical protein
LGNDGRDQFTNMVEELAAAAERLLTGVGAAKLKPMMLK